MQGWWWVRGGEVKIAASSGMQAGMWAVLGAQFMEVNVEEEVVPSRLNGQIRFKFLRPSPVNEVALVSVKLKWAGPKAGPFQGRQATEVKFAGAIYMFTYLDR